uniref:Sodefrin-like factor n=1 Tax=Panagrolaimus superbus TaxID=310955 RepID=A0A914Z806_9BILA
MSVQCLLIFITIIFSTIISALECNVGGICYGLGAIRPEPEYDTKKCEDACVSFKCILWENSNNIVMEGAGCYEDFLNVCKWTPTKYKDEIAKNLKDFSINNEALIFQSCSDKDGCATTLKASMLDEELFGSRSVKLQDPAELKCSYNDTPKQVFSKSICSNMIICEPAGLYEIDTPEDQDFGYDKECEACIDFKCTNTEGNTVIEGNGCWEDFIHACPIVPDNVKESIKKNIKDSFYFHQNYTVITCSNEETILNCDEKYVSFHFIIKGSVEDSEKLFTTVFRHSK